MKKIQNPILFILLIALVVRLLFVLFYSQQPILRSDSTAYDEIAMSIARGDGIVYADQRPNVYWAIGYPLFLSLWYWIFGHNHLVIRIVQAALGTLTVLLIFGISSRIRLGRKISLTAGGLAAFYPAFIGYTGLVLTETLSVFILSLGGYLGTFPQVRRRILFNIGWGAVFGYLALIRSELIIAPFLILFSIWFLGDDRKGMFRNLFLPCALSFFGIVLILMPWTIRNYSTFGRFIPLTVHDADTLFLSTHPDEWLEWYYDREPYSSLVKPGMSDIERADVLRAKGKEFLRKYPLAYLKMCLKRIFRFWIGGHSNSFAGMEIGLIQSFYKKDWGIVFIKSVFLGWNLFLVVCGIIGIFFGMRLRELTGIRVDLLLAFYSIIVSKWFIHTISFASPRYHIHIMPYLLIFSAITLEFLKERLDMHRHLKRKKKGVFF